MTRIRGICEKCNRALALKANTINRCPCGAEYLVEIYVAGLKHENKIYELSLGGNLIGRDDEETPIDVNIRLDCSQYIHHYTQPKHCHIQIDQINRQQFYLLSPHPHEDDQYPTKLIRIGHELVLHPFDQVYLKDNDVIKLGEFEVVFKELEPYSSIKRV